MTGRNELCHCGSGKKWKNCHGKGVPKGAVRGLPRNADLPRINWGVGRVPTSPGRRMVSGNTGDKHD